MEPVPVDESALKAVDDYWEYRRIVGDDDGGKLFTPEQYEEYKKKVLPQRMKNRLYVSFGVPGSIDCKLIGPETQCFCAHRYKEHKTDWEMIPLERPISLPCQVRGCCCTAYQYVPRLGPNPVRCRCKHLPQEHSEADGHFCKMCHFCSGFQSPYTCGCGQPSSAHQTLVETKQEREARGRPVGRDVPYAAMGGLTGFSSLLDGYLALEASSSGKSQNSKTAVQNVMRLPRFEGFLNLCEDEDRNDGFQQLPGGPASRIYQPSSKASNSALCKRKFNQQ